LTVAFKLTQTAFNNYLLAGLRGSKISSISLRRVGFYPKGPDGGRQYLISFRQTIEDRFRVCGCLVFKIPAQGHGGIENESSQGFLPASINFRILKPSGTCAPFRVLRMCATIS
jgi:hypothetical protein